MNSLITTAPVAAKPVRFFRLLAVAVVAIIATGGVTAQGVIVDDIGVQFQGLGTGLTSAQSAGVFPQTNYNVITTATPTSVALHDGNAGGTSATLTSTLGTNYLTTSTTPSGGDETLNSGLIYANSSFSFTVNSIPYPKYDLYVYTVSNRPYTESIALSGGATYYLQTFNGGGPGYVDGNPGTPYTYTLATATTNPAPAAPPAADYVLFATLTGSSLTVTLDTNAGLGSNLAGNSAVLSGFQIVALPEPASLGLLAIGGLALLKRRR